MDTKTKVTFTPGPWHPRQFWVIGKENLHICSTDQNWLGHSEQEANAQILAAAPELLAACTALTQWFEKNVPNFEKYGDYVEAKAAIAKAVQS